MKIFKTDWWTIALPDDWLGQSEDDSITFSSPESDAVLQISAFQKATAITEDDLHDFAVDDLREARTEEVTIGAFTGMMFPTVVDRRDMRVWYLMSGKLMMHATYVFADIDDEAEQEQIDQVLASLRVVKAKKA